MSSIIHVISGLGIGGAETSLIQLATGLKARGHIQHVISLRGKGALSELLEDHGIPVTGLHLHSSADFLPTLFHLRRLIQALSPDIVQGWMYHGNLAASLASLSIVTRHKGRILWNIRASNMDTERYGVLIKASRWMARHPETIIVNSTAGLAFHSSCGFPSTRMRVIYNGIDTAKFQPNPSLRHAFRIKHQIPLDIPLLMHVARVDPMKDHKTFLEAVAQLGLHTVLVGTGTDALKVPPNVRALGLCTDLETIYPAADFIVSSSAYGEGFSNVLAEGMSAGLVPIATDVGDAREIVGETGYIILPNDLNTMVQALNQAVRPEKEQLRKLGASARERIVAKFGASAMIDLYEELYSRSPESF